MAKIEAVQQVVDTIRPQVGEVDEERDEGGGEFADNQRHALVGQRAHEPANDTLQQLSRIILGQGRAFGVELDDDGQGAKELDLIVVSFQHAMGKLPSSR